MAGGGAGKHTPLFRSEAVAAKAEPLLGSIRVAAMPGSGLISLVAIGLLGLLVAFAIQGQATRKVLVSGVLLPPGGVLQLSAAQPGRLLELKVEEGQVVQVGQVLAVVDLSLQSAEGNTSALLVQTLEARRLALEQEGRAMLLQARQREEALRDRLRSLHIDIVQAEGELEAAEGRLRLGRQNLQRDEALAAQGFTSSSQVGVRQAELFELQSRERQARRNLEALRREAQGTDSEVLGVQFQSRTQQAQLDRTRASLVQEGTELASRRLLHLTAPSAGLVGTIAVHPGHNLQPGQAVISLLPAREARSGNAAALPKGPDLQAHLYAPSRAAGFVAPGQQVWIRVHAFPYQKFGMVPGTILDISHTPIPPQSLPAGMAQALQTAAQSQEPLYRITVDLHRQTVEAYGKTQILKAGMFLDADVIQERRAVWEWIFEPMIAVGMRRSVQGGGLSEPRLPGQ